MGAVLALLGILLGVGIIGLAHLIEQRDNGRDGVASVWDILEQIKDAPVYLRPRGQHRQGFSVYATLEEVARRDRLAALGAPRRRLAITA